MAVAKKHLILLAAVVLIRAAFGLETQALAECSGAPAPLPPVSKAVLSQIASVAPASIGASCPRGFLDPDSRHT